MGSLLIWWGVIECLGLLALPLTFSVFSARAAHGYPFAKIISILLVSYVAWVMGHLGVPYSAALLCSLFGFIGLNAWLLLRQWEAMQQWLRDDGRRTIALHMALWAAGFLFFAWQRSLHPDIAGQEKFMDFAFFNTLIRTESLPPIDPWMSGEAFNYYYYGYLLCANLDRAMAFVGSNISYNLCIATIAGLALSQCAAVVWTVTQRMGVAVLAAVLGLVAGNVDGFLQLLEKGSWSQLVANFDYWRSTRVVGAGDTINEFPYFTTIHGDLHPHFIVLPVSFLLLGLLLDPDRRTAAIRTAGDLWHQGYVLIGFTLASLIVISPWELPAGAMMTFLLLQRRAPIWPLWTWERLQAGGMVVAMLLLGYLLYFPFYSHFQAPQGGVGVKFAQTSLKEFLTVFSSLLVPVVMILVADVRKRVSWSSEQLQLVGALVALATVLAYMAGNAVVVVLAACAVAALVGAYGEGAEEQRGPMLLILGACITLLACEIVYIKDPYGEKLYRMNTVFKLYFQSWLLLTVAAGWAWAQALGKTRFSAQVRTGVLVTMSAVLCAACVYPAGLTGSRWARQSSLDGMAYLQRHHPDDFAAIQWIRTHVDGVPVVLEATGNPYSEYARISSNTGLPTVMGWANHEGLWRSHVSDVERRKSEVIRMFSARSLEEIQPLLDQYEVRYIVVGALERRDYPASGLDKFAQLPVVFSQGHTTVYMRE